MTTATGSSRHLKIPGLIHITTLKRLTRTSILVAVATIAATGCASTPRGEARMNRSHFDLTQHLEPATALLRSYEAALNRGDVEAIVSLYAPDAVFMAQHRSPATGRAQIEVAYREIFATIRLDIAFEIDEVVIVSPTVAYARTRSAGTTTILSNGAEISEGNQELFLLVRDDEAGEWRIGRYIFSTTEPRSEA